MQSNEPTSLPIDEGGARRILLTPKGEFTFEEPMRRLTLLLEEIKPLLIQLLEKEE